ncbi:MAG: Crp/Fnr family transcriptional regulator [Bacteroidales bacterium]|nr:Crp/Fnr family transcriptional regulator [Bacteroidales bacterium]
MAELEKYITDYFGVTESNALEGISTLFKYQTCEKGEFILEQGNSCNNLSFVFSGYQRFYAITEEGKEITQWISHESEFAVDLTAFITGSPSRWNIQALTKTELFTINKKDYDRLSEVVPDWAQFEKLFMVRCFNVLENRVFSHLSMTAEERYQFFFNYNKEIFNQVPLQYLASMLGMTPETLSRIRKKQLE